jgi:hypothetical protein
MAPLILYISGFRQHAGKTVTSIGLMSLLTDMFSPSLIGYIKPVGQEAVTLEDGTVVDKDAVLINEFSGIPDLDMETVSPVILGSGFTKKYLDSHDHSEKTEALKQRIKDAFYRFRAKKVIIVEGTGHPGVGGIVGLSNADVSRLIGSQILYLSGGGIGRALDMLEVDISYFLFRKSNVRGIIFNKIIPEKIDQVKRYITEDLLNRRFCCFENPLRIFGFLPDVEYLQRPSMDFIRKSFPNARVIGDPDNDRWRTPLNKVHVLSLAAEYLHPEKYYKPGDIVLLGSASTSRRLKLLSYNRTLKKIGRSLGGLVLTCGDTTPLSAAVEREIAEAGIPALHVKENTADSERIVQNCFDNTKLQVYDVEKVNTIKTLFADHFDLQKLIDTFALSPY